MTDAVDTNVAVGKFWKSSIEAPRDTFTIAGQDYEFVDFWPKNKSIRAWHKKYESGTHTDRLQFLSLSEIAVSTLKELPVWEALTKEEQDKLINGTAAMEQIEQDIINKLNKVSNKGKRKLKYVGIPRELVCSKCSIPETATRMKIQPALVLKYAEKKGLSVEEFCKTWVCQSCNPTKGRGRSKSVNSEFANLPTELVCKCGNTTPLNPYNLKAKAIKLGTTIEALIKSYVCQTCHPTKGRKRKEGSEKAIPIDLVCKCGKKVICPSSVVKKRAEKKGLTLEKFIKTWACQVCNPTKGRYKKVK